MKRYIETEVEITRRQFQGEIQHARMARVEGKEYELDLVGRLKRCSEYAAWRWREFHAGTVASM